jgi:PHD/YefM family antitoxin component YafN of YafNO toxin-antitoxin module
MAKIQLRDVVDYKSFRMNPGPQLEQASNGRPVLVVKGRQRFVVLDADSYDDIVERLEQLEQLQRGREPMQASSSTQRTGTEG